MGVWRGAQGPEEACVCEGRNSYTPVDAVRTTIVQQAIVRRGSLHWRRTRTGSPQGQAGPGAKAYIVYTAKLLSQLLGQ